MSDADRIKEWKARLMEIGGYSDAAASLITDFAIKAKSFELDSHGNLRPAGGIIVTMFVRLGTRLAEAQSVCEDDVETSVRNLLRYFSEKPLGDSVEDWRSRYGSNGVQRNAIDQFFGFAGRKFHEFSSDEKFLFNVRDAAWPSRKEEAAGTGGTFAERFIIFAKALCRISTTSNEAVGILFSSFYHEAKPVLPAWIVEKDGKQVCADCGSDITTDSKGAQICSNPLCDRNIAAGNFVLPTSFTSAGGAAPAGRSNERPERREREDRRSHDDGGDFPRNKPKQKKGPRFHENQEELPPAADAPASESVSVAATAAPANGFGNIGDALGGALSKIQIQG